MRSYFFSADTQEDMLGWVRALSQSAAMEPESSMNRYSTLTVGIRCYIIIIRCCHNSIFFTASLILSGAAQVIRISHR